MKLDRGTTERIFDATSSGKFPELEEYFPIIFDFEKLEDDLESNISSGAATSFSTFSSRM